MKATTTNYYGSLCTVLYEILHESAPDDELKFYLSYAEKNMKILEPLCGTGRFLVPFMDLGYNIKGIDLSQEMLDELYKKRTNANAVKADILKYETDDKYDYIFITSGSVSLFTDIKICKAILGKLKTMLCEKGKLVFAVDTIHSQLEDDADYKEVCKVKTNEGFNLIMKIKNQYDEATQTQYSPSIYELYDNDKLLQSEFMDFQTHLYKLGEMESYLKELGFEDIKTYSNFSKQAASDNNAEMFLFECQL